KLLPTRIKQNQPVALLSAIFPSVGARQSQNRPFILNGQPLNLGVMRDPLQIFIVQALYRRLFGLSDPCHFDLHGSGTHALPDASTTSAPNRISFPTR